MTGARFSVIVLAAGLATRFGSPKQASVYKGKPLLLWTLGNVAAIQPHQIVLVVNSDFQRLGLEIPSSVEIAENPSPESGMGTSIAIGMSGIERESQAVLIVVGDQPNVSPDHLLRLIKAVLAEKTLSASMYDDGAIGVPAAFARAHFDQLANLKGEKGAKGILSDPSNPPVLFRLRPEEQIDIDTVEELERINRA